MVFEQTEPKSNVSRTSIPSRLTCATSLHFRAGWAASGECLGRSIGRQGHMMKYGPDTRGWGWRWLKWRDWCDWYGFELQLFAHIYVVWCFDGRFHCCRFQRMTGARAQADNKMWYCDCDSRLFEFRETWCPLNSLCLMAHWQMCLLYTSVCSCGGDGNINVSHKDHKAAFPGPPEVLISARKTCWFTILHSYTFTDLGTNTFMTNREFIIILVVDSGSIVIRMAVNKLFNLFKASRIPRLRVPPWGKGHRSTWTYSRSDVTMCFGTFFWWLGMVVRCCEDLSWAFSVHTAYCNLIYEYLFFKLYIYTQQSQHVVYLVSK